MGCASTLCLKSIGKGRIRRVYSGVTQRQYLQIGQPASMGGIPVRQADDALKQADGRLPDAPAERKPRLLDQLRQALRSRHYSRRTEQTYCHWVKRFIFFHHVRHPAEMAEPEINAFLTHLAVREKVSASTQNQALSALLFLYRRVIGREVGEKLSGPGNPRACPSSWRARK